MALEGDSDTDTDTHEWGDPNLMEYQNSASDPHSENASDVDYDNAASSSEVTNQSVSWPPKNYSPMPTIRKVSINLSVMSSIDEIDQEMHSTRESELDQVILKKIEGKEIQLDDYPTVHASTSDHTGPVNHEVTSLTRSNSVVSDPSESYTQRARRLVEKGKKNRKANQNTVKPSGRSIRFNDSNEVQVFKICTSLISGLLKHKYSEEFAKPVDVVGHGIHDYYSIIKNPMDLGTVKENLKKRLYKSPKEFAADTRLIFENAMTYNPKSHIVHFMAAELLEFFNTNYAREEESYNMELDRSGKAKEKPKARDVDKRNMTYEEKVEFSENLSSLSEDELGKVVEIFKKRNIVFSVYGDVAVVNINNIDVDTLWELDRLVINYKNISKKNNRKSFLDEADATSVPLMNAPGNMEIAEETDYIGDRSVILALPVQKTRQ